MSHLLGEEYDDVDCGVMNPGRYLLFNTSSKGVALTFKHPTDGRTRCIHLWPRTKEEWVVDESSEITKAVSEPLQ